jgi:hypothetical protein
MSSRRGRSSRSQSIRRRWKRLVLAPYAWNQREAAVRLRRYGDAGLDGRIVTYSTTGGNKNTFAVHGAASCAKQGETRTESRCGFSACTNTIKDHSMPPERFATIGCISMLWWMLWRCAMAVVSARSRKATGPRANAHMMPGRMHGRDTRSGSGWAERGRMLWSPAT